MPNEIIEVAVNLAEPLLLFYLLKHKLAVKKRLLPAAIFGIAVLTAATTVMNKLEFGYVAVIIINLALFCINSAIFFTGDIRMKLVWASMMIYILVFANTFVMSGLYAVSSSLFMTALQPSALRITAQAAYILVSYLMVLIILKATKSLAMFSSKAAVGALFSCIICIVTMYLLLEVTIASAEAGISSVKHGIIAALLMTLVILVLVLFGKASIWAQKYAEERIVTDSLKREIQYDSEIKAVAQTVRQLKHDYSSHMSVIASYASEGDIDSLRKYMHDYKSEYGTIDRYAITGDSTLDSLLSYKKMICDAEGIELKITVFGESIQKTGLSTVELSSLFGNLIDNAINACRRLEPEKKKIALSIRKKSNMLNIRIENERLDDAGEKTSGEQHGLGLPKIKSIVEAHDGICTIMPEEGRFTVEILLTTDEAEVIKNED